MKGSLSINPNEYIYEIFFTKLIILKINLHFFQQPFKTQIDFQNYVMK